jgi:CBS domain containing-hemolysin-like protein
MERGAKEGALLGVEADLLAEIIELGEIRVREIMTPRVDTLFVDVSGADREGVARAALERRLSWIPVIEGVPDRVLGRVRVLDLFRKGGRTVSQLVMPVKFVPEVASALDLLHALREDRTTEAVVIDEWGGTAGYVTAENVFEELVGELRTEGEERVPAVVPLGEGRYRVAGGLTIRDWNEAFGMNVVPREFETVGGFVTAMLGRIPRAGDGVSIGGLELEVHEVRGRRVTSLDIGVRGDAAGALGERGGRT